MIEDGGDEGRAATNALSDTDFALQLWRAAVAAPLNPRAVEDLRKVHEYLLSNKVPCKTPPGGFESLRDFRRRRLFTSRGSNEALPVSRLAYATASTRSFSTRRFSMMNS